MMTSEQVRYAIHQAQRWRDLLWESILEDLEERSPASGAAARAAIRAYAIRRIIGDSTQRAIQAWPYLDAQARADWIWVCHFVHHTWIRGSEAAYASQESEQ